MIREKYRLGLSFPVRRTGEYCHKNTELLHKRMVDHTKLCQTVSVRQISIIDFMKRVPRKKFTETIKKYSRSTRQYDLSLKPDRGLAWLTAQQLHFRSIAQIFHSSQQKSK